MELPCGGKEVSGLRLALRGLLVDLAGALADAADDLGDRRIGIRGAAQRLGFDQLALGVEQRIHQFLLLRGRLRGLGVRLGNDVAGFAHRDVGNRLRLVLGDFEILHRLGVLRFLRLRLLGKRQATGGLIRLGHGRNDRQAATRHRRRGAAAPAVAPRRLTVVATVSKANETTGRLALAPQPEEEEQLAEVIAEEDFEEPIAENEPESLSDVAMSEAGDIVAEPDEEPAPAGDKASPQEQELVNALLDAERKLIEAEALGGAANANSPVAEIIRRISQRTREINEQAPQS